MSVCSQLISVLKYLYKSLTTAVKDCGIRVNSIAPEPIATPIYIKMDLLQEIAETNG